MAIKIVKYNPEYYNLWNNFVTQSVNGTFLFHRDFMEYHSDRFTDYSLLIFDQDKLVAILPANIKNNKVYSHQGLTYGGLVFLKGERTTNQIKYFSHLFEYLNSQGFGEIIIKEIPLFYHQYFNDIQPYLGYIAEAKNIRSEICSVIDLSADFRLSKSIVRDAKSAQKKGISVHQTNDFSHFWEHILTKNLHEKYQTQPVHTYDEILSLKNKFPNNIQFYELRLNDQIIGGTVLFINKNVVHVQYIAGLTAYRQLGGLDLLFYTLINDFKNTKKYFDFGTSNEDNGRKINRGLLFWKEGFGSRVITQNTYAFRLSNPSLDTVFL